MATKYYNNFQGNIGGANISISLTDNSKQVLETMAGAKEVVLSRIGAAARDNMRKIALEKGIYDTGELYRDIDYQVHQSGDAVDVGNRNISYSVFNEFGTVKMPARPYVAPGALDNRAEYQRIAEETIAEKFK